MTADAVARRVLPRAVVALSQVTWPARAGARLRRACGRRGRVELFFAFDDASSAVAVLELVRRVEGRRVRLLLFPVVRRGIPDDPAVERKRAYAVLDAARVGRRSGLELRRTAPLRPEETAPLAERIAAMPPGPAATRATVEALTRLWIDAGNPDRAGVRPPAGGADAVRRNERRMRRRGPYDTPAAWIHGQWFFAQDRLDQIEHRLDALGWTVA